LLESVRLGVTTWTLPVVAPAGTVVVIKELETTVKTAAVPLKVTLAAPVRLVPRILTAAPTLPEAGCVSTNGPKPTDSLKIVPQPGDPVHVLAPPFFRCPIKGPIGGLDQHRRANAVRAPALGAEVVERRQRAIRSDFEDRPAASAPVATAIGPATRR